MNSPSPLLCCIRRASIMVAAFLSSLSLFNAQTAASPAAPDSEAVLVLPEFGVSSVRSNAYRATDSMSAARIRTELIDTPASINVITGDFLKDISAASLFDATQYV